MMPRVCGGLGGDFIACGKWRSDMPKDYMWSSKLAILVFFLLIIQLVMCECKKSTDYIPFALSFGSYGDGDKNFNKPMGLDDRKVTLLVADYGNNRVVKYEKVSRTFIRKWGKYGTGDGEFNGPIDVAMYMEGIDPKYVYVVDSGNNRIQKFDGVGNFVGKWGTLGYGDGEFNQPISVDIDDEGYVYVTDFGNNRIQKFDSNGNFVLKWGSEGTDAGQFQGPYGIAFENDERFDPKYIYVTDQGNHRVQIFTKSGEFVRAFGSYGSGNGQLSSPSGISTQDGRSHIADTGNSRYMLFDISGKFVGKGGTKGTKDGQLMKPVGISHDGSFLFISDEELHRISVFARK
jgi:tripartite motif-containing protein 71